MINTIIMCTIHVRCSLSVPITLKSNIILEKHEYKIILTDKEKMLELNQLWMGDVSELSDNDFSAVHHETIFSVLICHKPTL